MTDHARSPVDARVAALESLGIMDTGPEQEYDDLTLLASQICGTPMAAITLLDHHRQWFKSRQGLQDSETPINQAFCAHAIAGSDVMIVPDAQHDPRFEANPLVTGDPHIRFYAGMPLTLPDGPSLGTLCVIDRVPRELPPDKLEALRALGRQVVMLLTLRQQQRENRALLDAVEAALGRRRATLQALTEGIVVLDRNGQSIDLNPAAEAILGISREEYLRPGVVHRLPYRLEDGTPVSREDLPALVVLRTGRSVRDVHVQLQRPDGSWVWLLINAEPLWEGRALTGAVASFTDVTARKKSEQALKMARDAAEAANRAKSTFLAHMSHELRTPLNAVIGFASLLATTRRDHLAQKDLQYVERIRDNGQHLLTVIGDILDLSRVEAGRLTLEMTDVALETLVADTVAQLLPAANHGVALVAEVPRNLQPVRADATRLKQALINLIGNALKFTEHGGVTVRVVAEAGVPSSLEVADTGVGIPPERMAAIFEPFEQAESSTARRFGGSGLGLAISRRVLEQMGFKLEATSEPGAGSTFRIGFGPPAER